VTKPDDLVADLKELIVETLMLEDVNPAEIKDDAPLFGDGLGLDSIDALELSLALKGAYGVELRSGDERNVSIFRSVQSLADFIAEEK